jgi:uncharacterized protein YciI
MKVVNFATYIEDEPTVSRLRPEHRRYMGELEAAGVLVAAGPFCDGRGGLFIYEVPSLAAAERIVEADPYSQGGAFAEHVLKEWQIVKAAPALLRISDED